MLTKTTTHVVTFFSIAFIALLAALVTPELAHGHGSGPEEIPPTGVVTELDETSTTSTSSGNTLPYVIGGSALVIVSVVGLSLWQRHKVS